MKKYEVDHVCVQTKKLDQLVELFETVFGMEVFKRGGEAPSRKVWLDGGIQINEAEEFSPAGGMDHLAVNVPESEQAKVFEEAAKFGCSQVPGLKEYQWIYLPEGQILELTDITKRQMK